MDDIVISISSKDSLIGEMSYRVVECTRTKNWYCALMSLFTLLEQVIRWYTNKDSRLRLTDIVQYIKDENLLVDSDISTIEQVFYFRNKYIHSNFHSNGFDIEGTFYPVSEVETAEVIFEEVGKTSLLLIDKLLSKA